GSIFKNMIVFVIPLVLSNLLQILFNAADTVVVGRWAGDAALAAVGSTSSLVGLLINLFVGISIGSNVLAARAFAAQQEKELSRTVHTTVATSLVGGTFVMLLGIGICKPALMLMHSPAEILPLSTLYLRIFFLGSPAAMLYNFCNALLRAKGDTRRPLIFLAIAGVLNVGLNLIFVIAFRWGVAGVAAATAISNYLSAILSVSCLMKETGGFKLEIRKIRFHKAEFLNILKIGIPAGVQGCLFSISNIFFQSSVNGFGKVIMAGNSASSSIESFIYFPMNAFGQASMTFISQNIGAGQYERLKKGNRSACLSVTVLGIALGCVAVLLGDVLLGLYNKNPEVIAAGFERLAFICIPYFLCGIMDTLAGTARGMGHSFEPMVITLFGACLLRIVWFTIVLHVPALYDVRNLYGCYAVTWAVTDLGLLGLIRHIHKKEIAPKMSKVQE
ncbi:MAG: MATE family efflux transporter, partial [Lachnospiraceae bacterium]|nr:MATE family efflux transporter [Lachnospiraceae bacterium]